MKKQFRMKLAIWKLRFSRGRNWITYPWQIMDLMTFFVVVLGLGGMTLGLIAVGIIIILFTVGTIDEFYGVWKAEQTYANRELNPFFANMSEGIKNLQKEVKELRELLKNANT